MTAAFSVAISPILIVASEISQAELSVVRVIGLKKRSDGLYFKAFGSGVVVDSVGSILTNAHVLKDSDKVVVQWKAVNGAVRAEEAKITRQDRSRDLALLRVASLDIGPLAISTAALSKGATVYAIGFPGVADVGDTADDVNRGFVESTVTQGVVGRVLTREISKGLSWEIVQHSAVISRGSSGGALVDRCGHLVGINTLGGLTETTNGDQVEASGYGFAIQSSQVFQFAFESGANPKKDQTSCETSGATPQSGNHVVSQNVTFSQLYFTLIVGLLLGGGAVLVVVVGRRRRHLSTSASTSGVLDLQWEIEGRDSANMPIRVVVSADRHTLSRPVIVGRDTSCDVVINDPTVSRNHAKLFVNSGQLWCQDLGSSNGTKVNHRLCDQSPMRVPREGVISLGKVELRVTTKLTRGAT